MSSFIMVRLQLIGIGILLLIRCSTCIRRHYYVAVEEVEWDYAPKGNLFRKDDSESLIYLENNQSIPTIGSKYMKAVYREYTDASFTTLKEQPKWLGILGVFFKAEVGDHIVVHFYNKARHNFTMHPHGLFYNKDSEGALYVDGSSGNQKADDSVGPGQKHTFVWVAHPDYGPTTDDPNCISWLVHSHHFAEIEMMTGAVCMLAVCRKGTLDEKGNRKDVDRDFALLFMVFDENFNLYNEENMEKYIPNRDENAIQQNFPIFQESNKKYSINGYIYGNLEGLEAEENETISFHIAVTGNDPDLYTVYFQGHNMIVYHHRQDTIGLYPGGSITATTVANNPGRWLLSSESTVHIQGGMQAFFDIKPKSSENKTQTRSKKNKAKSGKTRYYYIAAEEDWWDYAPTKTDLLTGTPLSEHFLARVSFGESTADDCKLNGRYKKAIFRGYTSRYFDEQVPHPDHLGFLGPPIKAEAGDTVKVMFYNKASRNYSIQAYRFFATEDENGIQYDNGPNAVVPPNGKRTYTWYVPESVAPTEEDPDCLYGRYYSAIDSVKDTYSGLTGPVVICRKGVLNGNEVENIDEEFYLSFSNVIEYYSHYFQESVMESCPGANFSQLIENDDFLQANIMNSLNGRVYGNLEGLSMCLNERVNWYMTSVGTDMEDLHSPHFHGNTFMVNGIRKDTFPLIADVFVTAYMEPDNVGIWSLEDQVTVAFKRTTTMIFLYEVADCDSNKNNIKYNKNKKHKQHKNGKKHKKNKKHHHEYVNEHHQEYVNEHQQEYVNDPTSQPKVRKYFIAAVEREWDYAPIDLHPVTGEKLSENEISQGYYNHDVSKNMIGHKYIKALYREFTDETFNTEKKRTADEIHLGMLGPFIKGEVGDTIEVAFKNNASFNYSIMPHGLFYDKANEGSPYDDGIPLDKKPGSLVRPGETYTYKWLVPERAGPGPDDFNCITWAYTSHVNYAVDINDGLIGPLVICRPGTLDEKVRRLDVDKEWGLLFFISNELESHYLPRNIEVYLGKNPAEVEFENPEYNIKFHVNGYMFATIPNVTMYFGEKAGVNLISFGNKFSTHTVHFHGNTFIRRLTGNHRHDVADILPGDFMMVELTGVNKGNWLVHCHVNNHSEVGMEMIYHVIDPDDIFNPPTAQ